MIGKLSGIIDTIGPDYILLDVQGVGYIVHTSCRALLSMGQAGTPMSLFIHTQVREDSFTLYGFSDMREKSWFELLTSVQGVGAKAGLAILSVCPPDKLAVVFASEDKTILRQADGVGPKLATRIMTELKDKAATLSMNTPVSSATVSSDPIRQQANENNSTPSQDGGVIATQSPPVSKPQDTNQEDAISALVNLGYARAEAYTAVVRTQAESEKEINLPLLIKEALRSLNAA